MYFVSKTAKVELKSGRVQAPGEGKSYSMLQHWPVRAARPVVGQCRSTVSNPR